MGRVLSGPSETSTGTNCGSTGTSVWPSDPNCRRYPNSWFAFRSCCRATAASEAPGRQVSATMARFSSSFHCRRVRRGLSTALPTESVHQQNTWTLCPPDIASLRQGYEKWKAASTGRLRNFSPSSICDALIRIFHVNEEDVAAGSDKARREALAERHGIGLTLAQDPHNHETWLKEFALPEIIRILKSK